MPILLYGVEACSLKHFQLRSLDFVVIRVSMKVLRTSHRQYVVDRLTQLGLNLPSVAIERRVCRFKNKFQCSNNILFKRVLLLR